MEFMKKQAAGFYLTVLAIILGAAGMVCYLINCSTDYFSNLGVDTGLVVCVMAALLSLVFLVIGSQRKDDNRYLDLLPVASAVFMMVGFVIFVSLRVNSIATILSFERNAQTMSDLSSAIAGMICCLLAAIVTIISSFCAIVKEK